MSVAETFWWTMTMGAIFWYMTVTVYVAIRGAFDIRTMLNRLDAEHRSVNNQPL